MALGVVGDLLEDVVVALDEAPRRGADAAARIGRRPGGSAANVAVAAAARGAAVRLVTAVGDDRLGRALVSDLGRAGVEVRARTGGRTGTVVVVVEPGGERTMYPDRSAAAEVRVEASDLVGLDLVHVPAYGLLAPPGHPGPLGPLLDDLTGLDVPISLDVSSLLVISRLGADLGRAVAVLRPVVAFANAPEAAALGWWPGRPPDGLDVVVKQGAGPALWLHQGRAHPVPAVPLSGVADTTGAGDAFAAGYLVAVLAGHAPPAAAAAGHQAAADHLRAAR